MNISSKMREILVREIRFVAEKMAESEKPIDKMYFFSAIYGTVNRIFNLEYDPELVFIHQVTQQAHEIINNRISLSMQRDRPLDVPANYFEKLEVYVNELADRIGADKKTWDILEKISELAYLSSGNGLYLHIKGLVKI